MADIYVPEACIVREAKGVIDELAGYLKTHLKSWSEGEIRKQNPRDRQGLTKALTVDEVWKAGSLGHGTAIPEDFDLDLVIYSRSITSQDVKAAGYKYDKWLQHLKKFLEERMAGRVGNIKISRFAVQFEYDKGTIDVDLLVSPYWETPADFYDFLGTIKKKHRFKFSVNASKWQVDFLEKQEPQAKNFITRAKVWRNKMWPKGSDYRGRPNSYVLSLLVLSAHKKASMENVKRNTKQMATRLFLMGCKGLMYNKEVKGTTEILQEMAQELTRKKTVKKKLRCMFNICWEVHYKRRDYPKLLPPRPRIVDPANPSNNLYATGIIPVCPGARMPHNYDIGENDWTVFQEKISTLDLTIPFERELPL